MRGYLQLHEQSRPMGGPRLTRRGVINAAASLAAVAGPLAGCAPGQDSGARNAATQAPVTIRYALDEIVPSGQGTYSEGRQLVTAAFMAQGGPIRVETEALNPVYAAILAQAAAGNPPDALDRPPRSL